MPSDWIHHLPKVRGRYSFEQDLKSMVWFQVGGPADVVFKPADPDDLADFLKNLPGKIPVTILGVGSNVLIRDGGIPGVVVKLTRGFTHIKIDRNQLTVGAGALAKTVALSAATQGIEGLEFLSGIPGTIGGVVKMNGGAYGAEVKDILISCKIIDRQGNLQTISLKEIDFSYRHSSISDTWIITEVTLKGTPGDPVKIQEKLNTILEAREKAQPIRARTGGSTFKNPPDGHAWRLIDQAGCRGLKKGDAQVSEKHCNFLINTGNATAGDLESLGDEVKTRVKEKTGTDLEWEVIRLGREAQ